MFEYLLLLLLLLLLLIFVNHNLFPIPATSTLLPLVNRSLLYSDLFVALFQALLAALGLDRSTPKHLAILKAALLELVGDLFLILHPDTHW